MFEKEGKKKTNEKEKGKRSSYISVDSMNERGDKEKKNSQRDRMKVNMNNDPQQLALIAASVNKVDWKRLEKIPVSMDELEDYIELLYEGKDKVYKKI